MNNRHLEYSLEWPWTVSWNLHKAPCNCEHFVRQNGR